ncbi:MAG: hypothetical protein V1824_01395 [archaeon]
MKLEYSLSFIIFGLITVAIIISLFFNIGYNDGSHTGYVTATELHKGIPFSDNIAYFKTDLESTQEDMYCVNDTTVLEQLKEAQKAKKNITIYYSNPFIYFKGLCNYGSTIIYKIE